MNESDLEEARMQAEHDAWLEFMAEFYNASGATEEEVNVVGGPWDDTFIALRVWGEKIAKLRRYQPPVKAMDERGFPVPPKRHGQRGIDGQR